MCVQLTNGSSSFGSWHICTISYTENVVVSVMLQCVFINVKKAGAICYWRGWVLQDIGGTHWWTHVHKVVLKYQVSPDIRSFSRNGTKQNQQIKERKIKRRPNLFSHIWKKAEANIYLTKTALSVVKIFFCKEDPIAAETSCCYNNVAIPHDPWRHWGKATRAKTQPVSRRNFTKRSRLK